MSTRTQNIELEKPTSDENYDISVFNRNSDKIDQEIALRVKTADIQNNLTSTATNKPLSAAQGKALNDGKVNISDIQNSLTSTATNKPLSAAQGKILSDRIVANKPVLVEGGGDATAPSANTMFYTGIAISIPANKVFAINAFCDYNNTRCSKIAISRSNNPTQDWSYIGVSDGFSVNCSYITYNSPLVLYVHASFLGASTNSIYTKLITWAY